LTKRQIYRRLADFVCKTLTFGGRARSEDFAYFCPKILSMKSTLSRILAFSLLAFSATLSAQGIEFFHGTWAEAQAKAQAEEKLIFVDAFASWCGPCKRMARETFPDAKAGEFFNANFVNLKIDMEKPENQDFAAKYPVGSYPTLMFIDPTGKVVLKEIGAKDVDGLLATGRKALGKNDKSADYEKKYNAGDRSPQLMFDYVRSLNAAGKPSLKITNEYLGTQKDLTTEFNLRFLVEGATEADSRVFELLLKNRDKAIALLGEEAVNGRFERACQNTLEKAIKFKNATLLEEVKTKMKTARPDRAEAFGHEADLGYYKATKDTENYLKAAKSFQKSEIKNNSARLHDLVVDLIRAFPDDKKVLGQAEKWAKTAAENGGLPEYWMTLAGIYKLQGEMPKARATAEKAKKDLGEKDSSMRLKIDYFIESLGG
jgi:thiol-disulfide isomerase/thioredoxin